MNRTLISSLLLVLCLSGPRPAPASCVDYAGYIHWLGGGVSLGGGSYEEDIFVSGTTVYLATANTRLGIVDVSDPVSPILLSSFALSGGGAGILHTTGVTVVGSTAYVTAAYAGLFIVNVSNPASPAINGFVDTPSVAEDVAIAGNRAYVADLASGLQVIDLPTKTIIGHVDTPGNAFGVAINGNIAYVADEFVGLQVIDISNPASPTILATVPNPGTAEAPGNAQDVEVVGSMVYVADGKSGLVVIDASNPAAPVMVGNVDTPGYVWDLRVQGTSVFVADDTNGFTIIDISDPAAPVIVGNKHAGGGTKARAAAVSGTTGFWLGGGGLLTIDVSSFASAPVLGTVAVTPPFGSGYGIPQIAASGSLVCASHGTSFVSVFDVSDPTSPVRVSYFAVGPNPGENGIIRDVAMFGSMVYVTYLFSTYGGLLIVDLSTPASPQILGHLDLAPPSYVAVSGTTAFVSAFGTFPGGSSSPNGLWIVDASDPRNPTLVGGMNPPYDLPGGPTTVVGSLAFITFGGGFKVVDVSNLASPTEIGQIDLSDLGVEQVPLTLSGDYGFVPIWKNNKAGVLILQVTPYPDATRRLGMAFAPLGGHSGLAVSGLMVYDSVDMGGTGFYVVDATDLMAPRYIGEASLDLGMLVIAGNSVCVTGAAGFMVLPRQCASSSGAPEFPISLKPTLGAAFPNPGGNGSTFIPFSISNPGTVKLRIVDLNGREVRTLVNAMMEPGERRVEWDGRNAKGERVSAGIYIYELNATGLKAARKLVRLR